LLQKDEFCLHLETGAVSIMVTRNSGRCLQCCNPVSI